MVKKHLGRMFHRAFRYTKHTVRVWTNLYILICTLAFWRKFDRSMAFVAEHRGRLGSHQSNQADLPSHRDGKNADHH
jgi:hypothetical protein